MIYSEKNLIIFLELLAIGADTTIFQTPNYHCLQDPAGIYPNVLFYPNFNLENAPIILKKIRESTLPQVIRCSPILTNEITLQALKENTAYQRFWAAMSLNLRNIKPFQQNEKLEIKVISERSDMEHWARIIDEGLMGKTGVDSTLFYKMSQNNSCRFYLAFENAIPVATALTVITGDEVGIYLIATDENYRRKGIGQQITTQALLDARALGCTFAHLEATDLGKSVYEKIGFLKMSDIAVFRV
ncbi:MAG: GNAT family N-acetyltransferase [Saprospiraceae bacterium]